MTTKTFEQLKHILVERFGIDPAAVQPITDLQKDLNLDSMDSIDLLLAINEVFDIRVPEQMLEDVHTISDLVAVVEKHCGKKRK
jgi:acyl carrier protein